VTPPSHATFDTLRAGGPELVEELVDLLTKDAHERVRHANGFVRAHVLLSLDRATAVIHCQWAGKPAAPLGEFASRPGVAVSSFVGTQTAGVAGPAASARPEIAAIATRHVDGHGGARELGELLVRSGTWKRHFPGFIGATAHISPDGRTYVNYPQWIDEATYRSYMADPRIALGQQEIARLEAAPPEFVLARVAADIGPP